MEPHPNKKKKAKLKESGDPEDAIADTTENNVSTVETAAALIQGSDAAVSAEESLLIRRRAMNTIHSRRKRERQRIEIEVLKEQCAEFHAKNSKLRSDNAQLELLLRSLQPPPAMDASAFPASTQPMHAPHPQALAQQQQQMSQPSAAAITSSSFLTTPNNETLKSFLQSQPSWSAAPQSFLPPQSSMMYAAAPSMAATGDLGRRATSSEAPAYAAPTTNWPSVNDVWVQQLAALAMAQLQQQLQMQQQQQQLQQYQQQQQYQQHQFQQQQQPTAQQLLASLPPALNIQLLQQLLQAQSTNTDATTSMRPNDNAGNDPDANPPPSPSV